VLKGETAVQLRESVSQQGGGSRKRTAKPAAAAVSAISQLNIRP